MVIVKIIFYLLHLASFNKYTSISIKYVCVFRCVILMYVCTLHARTQINSKTSKYLKPRKRRICSLFESVRYAEVKVKNDICGEDLKKRSLNRGVCYSDV